MNCITITICFIDHCDQIKINDVIGEEFFFALFDNGNASTERHLVLKDIKMMTKINFRMTENDVKKLYDLIYRIIKYSNSNNSKKETNNFLELKFNDNVFLVPKSLEIIDDLMSILRIDTMLQYDL